MKGASFFPVSAASSYVATPRPAASSFSVAATTRGALTMMPDEGEGEGEGEGWGYGGYRVRRTAELAAEDTVGGGVAVRSATERAHVHVVLLDRLVVFPDYLQALRLKGVHHKLHLCSVWSGMGVGVGVWR